MPIVADGVIYLSGPNPLTWAIDAGSGRMLWSQLTCDPALGYSISDAPHVGGGRVFVGNERDDEYRVGRPGVARHAEQGPADRTQERLFLRHRPPHRRTAVRQQLRQGQLGHPHRHGNRPAGAEPGGHVLESAAGNGERLWSAETGSAITAAPVSYLQHGRQRVLIPIGAGSAMQFAYPTFHVGREAVGPARLLFQERSCYGCHGKQAVARVGGTVPDLRYATQETHLQWNGIVTGGARSARGMPAFEITAEEAEAIGAYVLSKARELKNKP